MFFVAIFVNMNSSIFVRMFLLFVCMFFISMCMCMYRTIYMRMFVLPILFENGVWIAQSFYFASSLHL